MSTHRRIQALVAVLAVAGGTSMAILDALGAAAAVLTGGALLVLMIQLWHQNRVLGSKLDAVQHRLATGIEKLVEADRSTPYSKLASAAATLQVEVGALRTSLSEIGDELRELEGDAQQQRARLRREVRSLRHEPLTQSQALTQLLGAFTPDAPLPPVGGWAMEPTTLVEIVDLIARVQPQVVLECGSGTSTVWIAQALRRNGSGRVISLDHDAEYAHSTRTQLARHSLSDWAEVRYAPLVPTATELGEKHWYEVDLESIPKIDLLVVDGPPEGTGEMARYPAVPVLSPRLSASAVIVLDDAHRRDEREAARLWTDQLGLDWSRDIAGRATVLGSGPDPANASVPKPPSTAVAPPAPAAAPGHE
ncbi:class I SAM-dependent methyltransferase [Ruania halotolerans]|uniref:class I SAM-dependent methyltransferase n=1 Tax=Ruania halotolerans TaxID=2897773 RepID=UPI001E425116|nr:class I SAM-dependent methyltransferase [Ruania halotolerans]UFU07549.1 class I SAM-dependent methyltransferase [Ruania halotolerans]